METIIVVSAVVLFAALLGLPALNLVQLSKRQARFDRLRAGKSPSILRR